MPHIVLEGRVSIADCERHFEPSVWRDGERVIKLDRFYREREGRAALIEALVSDRGHTQKFFIQLTSKGEGLTVRLEPMTDPEKTAGVRRALAYCAHRIRGHSGCSYGPTNIGEHLIPER